MHNMSQDLFVPELQLRAARKAVHRPLALPLWKHGYVAHTLQGKVPWASQAHLLQMKESQATLWRPVVANFNIISIYTTHLAKISYIPFQEHQVWLIGFEAYTTLVLLEEIIQCKTNCVLLQFCFGTCTKP